jgi:O-palmitoleoyl-L-serine hydrolase
LVGNIFERIFLLQANVTAVFAPSCIGHSVLTKRDWLDIKIEDISLAEALRCWDQAGTNGRPNHRHADHKERKNRRRKHNNGKNKKEHLKPDGRRKLTKEQREQRRKERQKNQKENGVKSTKVPRLQRSSNGLETKAGDVKQTEPRLVGRHRNPNHRKRNKNNNNNNNSNNNNNNKNKNIDDATSRQNIRHHNNSNNNKNKKRLNHPHHNRHKQNSQSNSLVQILEPKKCSLRLLEKCSWPQCNHSCPSLTNPLTGEEMKFLELLASFGLDMEAVATALGVDMQTLNNMDHAELVNLLTQQVS